MAPKKTIVILIVLLHEAFVQTEPIRYTRSTFQRCSPGKAEGFTIYCCLPQENLEGPIVDFVPAKHHRSKKVRVRKALQCLEGEELKSYTEKLQRGYNLLRALPDNDPRSLFHQNAFHCAYGTGSLTQDGTNITTDIHFSWFFFPWHRFFLYFHERILQSLLDDPDFTLHFWNYDNPITVPKPRRSSGGCFKAGNSVPKMYNDPRKSTYSWREERACDPTNILDMGITRFREAFTPLSADKTIHRSRAAMHASLITHGNTWENFLGRKYSVGDVEVTPAEGSGSFEIPHASVHYWVGKLMFPANTSASDPLFYAHHANVDRIWAIWPHLAPNRSHPTENPDWMEAEFLFWDETKTIRRVKIGDSLSTETFGYKYEQVHDESWILYEG